MAHSLRRVVRATLLAAAVAAGALILTSQVGSSQSLPADDECLDGRVPCAHVACVSACWEDGTVPNHGTKVKQTLFAPIECEIPRGCITQSCK